MSMSKDKIVCPKCGSGNVVGFAGEWECFDCGHKFKTTTVSVRAPAPPTYEARKPPVEPVKAVSVEKGLGTGKSILLFVLGLFLAILVFPVAFFASALLGYILGFIAIILAIVLIAKRGSKNLSLILGAVLLVLSLISVGGTFVIHASVYTVSKAVEEVVRTQTVEVGLGVPLKVEEWEITVEDVKETRYIRSGDSFYGSKEDMKIILVKLKIRNVGKEVSSASDIWGFTLVSDKNKSYEDIYPLSLEWLFEPTEEVKAAAIKYSGLDTSASLAPGTYIEGHVLFQIPVDESPEELYFKVGVIGLKQVRVKL